ncbi:MAG: peptidoglycan editing factor PgeF [Bacteroides sp.]
MENLKYINNSKTTTIKNVSDVTFVQCNALGDIKFINHAFSTRFGGVSEDIWKSMNLNFGRGDDENAVLENFKRFAKAIDTPVENMVCSMQTHTTNVIKVTKDDCGNGIITPQKFNDVDGLITNEPGVCLVTTYADCVPLYFIDVAGRAVGLSHSGWRGTVGNITNVTVEKMREEFGTLPENIVTFIGPSICKNCYEVSEDVAMKFAEVYTEEEQQKILTKKNVVQGEQKYLLDLHAANVINMKNAGIPIDNIHVTDLCTCCNPNFFFSHRASRGQRGGLCAFLEIRDDR